MNDNDGCEAVVAALILFIVVPILTFWWGRSVGERDIKNEAVSNGHGEYYLDESSERQWRWVTSETRRDEDNQ